MMRKQLSRMLCTIVYGVCIIPGGIIMRLFRHDPLHGKPDLYRQSYWRKREPHGLSDPMKHPF